MIQLYQAEWCPHSAVVRRRLTELGIDYVARQVPADREERDELERATGGRSIPAAVLEDGSVVAGSEELLAHLASLEEPAGAVAHRAKEAMLARYAITERVDAPFAEVVERVRAALQEEGFGVLCEIDVQATLREKLGIERSPYLILGACNPPLAHRALEAEPDLGVFLPCNVILYEQDGATVVSAVDAKRMLSLVGNDELEPIAGDIRARLERIVATAT